MKNIILIAGSVWFLAACGADSSDIPTDIEASEGTYSLDRQEGQTNVTVKSGDGSATLQTGKGVAIDLPDGFSIYPGAKVENNTSFSANDGAGALVNMVADASSQDMVDFYRKQAIRAGLDITTDATMGENRMLAGQRQGRVSFTFNTSPADGKTRAQLMIGEGLE